MRREHERSVSSAGQESHLYRDVFNVHNEIPDSPFAISQCFQLNSITANVLAVGNLRLTRPKLPLLHKATGAMRRPHLGIHPPTPTKTWRQRRGPKGQLIPTLRRVRPAAAAAAAVPACSTIIAPSSQSAQQPPTIYLPSNSRISGLRSRGYMLIRVRVRVRITQPLDASFFAAEGYFTHPYLTSRVHAIMAFEACNVHSGLSSVSRFCFEGKHDHVRMGMGTAWSLRALETFSFDFKSMCDL